MPFFWGGGGGEGLTVAAPKQREKSPLSFAQNLVILSECQQLRTFRMTVKIKFDFPDPRVFFLHRLEVAH